MSVPVKANTFRPIQLDPQTFASLPFAEFVEKLLAELFLVKQQRSMFYEDLRRTNAAWANGARKGLAALGALALFLTALVGAVRLAPGTVPGIDAQNGDKFLLVAVLVIYAVMGAINFYEKGSDKTPAYFRQIGTILAIRDLWTKLEFALLKELRGAAADPSSEETTRARVVTLAETFCADLDKIATGELAEFRTELLASLTELQDASSKGLHEVSAQIGEQAKAVQKAADEAKAAAIKAQADAKAAAKAAEDAGKPGFLNVSIVGDFDDEVVVSIGGSEIARSTAKAIGIERVSPGLTKLEARAKKGAKTLAASMIVEIKSGLQDCRLTLS